MFIPFKGCWDEGVFVSVITVVGAVWCDWPDMVNGKEIAGSVNMMGVLIALPVWGWSLCDESDG